MKCRYCENEATKRDYRTWDGQTGKELVCDDCFGLSNEGLSNKRSEIDTALEDVIHYPVDVCVEEGMRVLWDTINIEVEAYVEEIMLGFKNETGYDLNDKTISDWREKMFDKISKEIKKTII